MLSVIVYGRNDNYGYNQSKRVALSLNVIAEVLDADGDEILFVDYNTPDDLPTFPEAIHDTLTARAKALLRVLRVQQGQHRKIADQTPLQVVEPVARNVALRRSNPANAWILSTNTDMIFVPRGGRSLSAVVERLAAGIYHAPRFELPQALWEAIDRLDPGLVLEQVAGWGRSLHLDEIVRNDRDFVRFDGPGDFQLMRRADLFDIDGFDERILLGWHVDSNIARRLFLVHGAVGDLSGELLAYHCEHTRLVTPKHAPGRPADDFETVAGGIAEPSIAGQREHWGLAGEDIEEIRLGDPASVLVAALTGAIGAPMTETADVTYGSTAFDRIDYDARHVLPFVVDALVNYPRDLWLGWFGARRDLLERFVRVWRELGFRNPVLVAGPASWLGAELPDGAVWRDDADVVNAARVCVFDFAPPGAPEPAAASPAQLYAAAGLRRLATIEVARASTSCRVIAVNCINNRFERLVAEYVGANLSPMATRLRQGFMIRPAERRELLPLLAAGDAGRRAPGSDAIEFVTGANGLACYGPHLDLPAGRYRATLGISARIFGWLRTRVVVEIVAASVVLAARKLTAAELRGAPAMVEFVVPDGLPDAFANLELEIRLHVRGRVAGALRSVTLQKMAGE